MKKILRIICYCLIGFIGSNAIAAPTETHIVNAGSTVINWSTPDQMPTTLISGSVNLIPASMTEINITDMLGNWCAIQKQGNALTLINHEGLNCVVSNNTIKVITS